VNVNPGGDWTTQAADPDVLVRALGAEMVKLRARAGDREAQFSLGYRLVNDAESGDGTPLGTTRSPKTDVGLSHCTAQVPVAHKTEIACCVVKTSLDYS